MCECTPDLLEDLFQESNSNSMWGTSRGSVVSNINATSKDSIVIPSTHSHFPRIAGQKMIEMSTGLHERSFPRCVDSSVTDLKWGQLGQHQSSCAAEATQFCRPSSVKVSTRYEWQRLLFNGFTQRPAQAINSREARGHLLSVEGHAHKSMKTPVCSTQIKTVVPTTTATIWEI